MGHPEPFDLKYVSIGNENCYNSYIPNYLDKYPLFYNAIKNAYPDMQIISNCDATKTPLKDPAQLFDYHIYDDSQTMFQGYYTFDNFPRSGPKAFISEYAVKYWDSKDSAKNGGVLMAALGEAGFLMGLEKNRYFLTS